MTTINVQRHPRMKKLVVRLSSNEELGVLDSGYIEDYFGADGFCTLHHVDTTEDFSMRMDPVPDATPGLNNDVFEGSVLLRWLPDGEYEMRFRVRDVAGNYVISNAYSYPRGDEDVVSFKLVVETVKGKP